uniref:RRM domain-containing protein n=1 Tax=Cucumis sativus TaxID=3659 RepID=A0A0A0KTR0_CUCSA
MKIYWAQIARKPNSLGHLTVTFCRLPSIGALRLRTDGVVFIPYHLLISSYSLSIPRDLCLDLFVVVAAFASWGWAVLRSFVTMTRVYIGNLDPRVTERDLEDEFRMFGVLRSVWVARRPPGYAFIEFDDRRDALDAIQALDGKNGWRVELSHNSKGGGGGGGRRGRGGGGGGVGGGLRRSPSPRRRRSPSYERYGRRSNSPRGKRSPRRRSITPPKRGRSYSRSPPYRHARRASPYANGAVERGYLEGTDNEIDAGIKAGCCAGRT